MCFWCSEQISKQQSQIDRLYVSLKDLAEERKGKLEQYYWLFQLNREVDELEQWIAEREVIAGSPELGQDFEHVTEKDIEDGEICVENANRLGHFEIKKEVVLDLLKNIRVDKSPGPDDIYPRLLRETKEEIAGALTKILYPHKPLERSQRTD
eukprot:g40018.t1